MRNWLVDDDHPAKLFELEALATPIPVRSLRSIRSENCKSRYASPVATQARTLDELRAMVEALDPEVLAAEGDVDRTLIALALERSPLERVRFAQQMLETLLSFKRVEPSGV